MQRDARFLVLLTFVIGLGIVLGGRDDHAQAAGKPDFTGNWELNVSQSKFGKMTAPSRMTLQAARRGEVLHAVQTTYDPSSGPNAVEGDWFMDGKEHPLGSEGKMLSISKWDGNALVSERKSKDSSYDETIRLTLSNDSKTATEEIKVKDPNGSDTRKLVWERK